MRRLQLDVEQIVRLYVEEGLRGAAIAQRFGCSDAAIYRVLEDAGIERSRWARLPREEVVALYRDEGLTLAEIADRYGVTRFSVARFLRRLGFATQARRTRLERKERPCRNSGPFRAYCMGFAIGDLAVARWGANGVEVKTNTTHAEQFDLLRETFGPFGRVVMSGLTVHGYLDQSFSFLLKKYDGVVPPWVRTPNERAAFAAGYIDAEGSFGIYEGRARFQMGTYDAHVLAWLHAWCGGIGVESKLTRIALKGAERVNAPPFRRDLWRLSVNYVPSLLRFIATLEPFLRHAGRRAAMDRARSNLEERLRETCWTSSASAPFR